MNGKHVTGGGGVSTIPQPEPSLGFAFIFEPGANTNRTRTAQIRDDCTTGQHFIVTSVKVNIFGLS